jgi:hypothetical protein
MAGSDDLGELEIGGGQIVRQPRLLLRLPPIRGGYSDAQLDDYRDLQRRSFPWRPPVELDVRARAHPAAPAGTLGFGFWNDPFTLSLGQGGAERRLPAAPQALWFFYGSEPNDFAFPGGIRGGGWRASSLRSRAVPGWLLAAPALAAFVLSYLPGIRRPVMRSALRQVRAAEHLLALDLDSWHRYRLLWQGAQATFFVDDEPVLMAERPSPGPLGFVAWIDNQYAVATPEDGFRFGVLTTEAEQRLELDGLTIKSLGG